MPKAIPEPKIEPKAPVPRPEPPPVEPPVGAEQEPALGSGGYSLAQPQMIGDFLGPNLTRRFFNVPLSGTLGNFIVIGGVFTGGFTSQKAVTDLIVSMPDVSRGPFKIAENESPRPVDRVFAYYSYFRVQGSANNIFALGSPPGRPGFTSTCTGKPWASRGRSLTATRRLA
jgi:hypothetical protein